MSDEKEIDRKHLAHAITGVMIRALYYQDRGEPPFDQMSCDIAYQNAKELPREMAERYRNDVRFHAQVTRAVAWVLREIPR